MSEGPIAQIAEVNPPLPRYVAPDEIVSFLRMQDVSENGGIIGGSEAPFWKVANGFTRFAEGDALFAKITPCMENGKGALALELTNGIGCGSTEFHVLRAKDDNSGPFIYQVLQSKEYRQAAQMQMSGSAGQQRVQSEFFRRHQIHIPPPPQQRRIATILTTLDEVIEATEKLVEKHQQIKAGLMHDLFTRGVTPDGNLRPTSEARKSKFGWIPKSWRVGSLLDVASPTRQPILTGPFGADLGTGDFVEAGVPLLRIGNVQTGILDLENLLFVSERKATLLDRYRVREGDLLFARQGATTGRNTLATAEVEGWLINYHIIRVALDHSLCSPFFIETAFNSDVVKKQIERDKGRGTREGINSAQLRCLELPLADFEEQQMITQILGSNQSLLKKSQDNLAKLRHQKQGLMHDLLTGRVRVEGGNSAAVSAQS
jgi:type I restriction enzyme S subunit